MIKAGALGLRPARRLKARAYFAGDHLLAIGELVPPRGVPARRGCRGTVTIRILVAGRRTRTERVRLGRNCEFFLRTRRTRARPLVTIRFNGNARVLPRLVFGP